MDFWLSTVNTFVALYEAEFKSIYSRIGKTKHTPHDAHKCVKSFYVSFPSTLLFTAASLFEEEDFRAHDFGREVARMMNGGSSLDN